MGAVREVGRAGYRCYCAVKRGFCDWGHYVNAYRCQESDSLTRIRRISCQSFVQGGDRVTRPQPRRRARTDVGPLTEFAEFVAKRRHALGLTQLDLADLADVSISTVRNVEAGRISPTLDVTLRVLDALGSTLVAMSQASATVLPAGAADLGTDRSARR
ncbi:helix-turn-helix transcriptional regulator [Nocardia aurantia]|uniref:helix-turn-helix transcriptional regulator n=1 Tax=Nocardia aurantia TaxID=2585199 RepID=UPI001297D8B2|nr:helix-turn-helix transcriptional regulator [Nocardia aurantia]